MTQREYELGSVELQVLKVLWEVGPAPVRGVLDAITQRGRQIAYTTVQTMLTRLEQKGFVRADKSGTAFVYRALISREQITRSRLRQLVNQLYDGAAGPLVLQLVRTQRLRAEELEQLQKLIEELDAKEG